ncbi:hypothetical protein HYT26_01930 [Candidatus Pacearchaeota archaeon]|nr:hypothetical protein [Candidatus Pacearchaeota archaeon]
MRFIFTPEWFINGDVLIDPISFIVLFVFFALCLRTYKLNKKKNFLYLSAGFFLIAIAQLALILTKLILYYDTPFTQTVGRVIVTYEIVSSVDIFYFIGFFMHRLLTLSGLYIIYRLPVIKKTTKELFLALFLALYFIFISAVFSSKIYYLFYITSLSLLFLIIKNYYLVYKNNKSINTKILILAFLILALSQAIFIFSSIGIFYVAARILELASYLIFLFLIIRILKHKK